MVMRKDNTLQMSYLMCNASYTPLYAQWNIAAHANDNYEYITYTDKRTWDEGDYTYTYDALNRLASAVFTPAEGLADRPGIERGRIPDFSAYYDYDLRGNTTNVVRYGVVDAISDLDRIETFGTLDELSCAYDGNRLSNITATTDALPFDGVTGLHADGEFELAYNDAGDMVSDTSRGLLYTRWNADGHPMQYDIEGGHRQLLGWDAFGNHQYTSYETSVAPVSAGMRPGRTRRTSVRAYSGDGHVLRGGAGNSAADTLEMLRFAGGYFDARLVPHYYVTDYLGSNIAVIRTDGVLVQSATYYPYGEPHRDPAADTGFGIAGPDLPMSAPASASSSSATASTVSNPYLYGDKEYVRRDGLREYIYGARMCIPSETRFSSIDPLCEKYYHLSPYVFCAANPIRYTDPTGMDIYSLNQDGTFVLTTETDDNFDTIVAESGKSIGVSKSFISSEVSGTTKTLRESETGDKTLVDTYYSYRELSGTGMKQFEFFANNSEVEWSRLELSDENAIIGSSKTYGSDATANGFIDNNPERKKLIQAFDHTHPSTDEQSKEDVDLAKSIESFAPKAKFRVFYSKDFKFFHKYNGNSEGVDLSKPIEMPTFIFEHKRE